MTSDHFASYQITVVLVLWAHYPTANVKSDSPICGLRKKENTSKLLLKKGEADLQESHKI